MGNRQASLATELRKRSCYLSGNSRTTTGNRSPGRISTTTQVSPWKGTLSHSMSGCRKVCSPIMDALPVWERTNTVNLGTAEMLTGGNTRVLTQVDYVWSV